ncbi:unnamed protein product [Clonostachys rosea f. rosea IK726]|uniref:Uncharacterized protein n=1 Tax=Clonostachys rosea f. rosea IK726 TaxID=1349383 RepID=A0ACA9UIZ9_BIOOC|nr:unnamed protein product [Clonostachys rosea f. rosea IK726]
MVCIKQVSIPAVVLLSLAEQAVAAPVARRGDIDARDAVQADGSIDLAIRGQELYERGLLKKVPTPIVKATKAVQKNPGKTFDRVLSTGNTAMAVANTHKTQTGKREVEELDERDIDEEFILALRDLGLDERSILSIAKKVGGGVVKAAKAVGGVIKKNPGKTFDRTLSTGNTAMAVANTHKTQTGKREVEELDERDIDEEFILALRDLGLDERSILSIAKKVGGGVVKAAKAVGGVIKKNPGKTFDRTLSTANTAMTVANTNKALKGKRDLEDIEERDWEDIEERDWEDVEERDVEELEERDWEDLEERGVGTVLKKVAKGAFGAMDIISKNQGKSYNRANAAANSAMQVAQTKKKQEKRDFEERDFEYLNSLSQRDLEDLELVVRALYGDYLEDY